MHDPAIIDDADERYLAAIALDCEDRLGPGAELLGLTGETDEAGVRLRLQYRLQRDGEEHDTEVAGASLFDAHRALRDAIVIDRVRYGFADLVRGL